MNLDDCIRRVENALSPEDRVVAKLLRAKLMLIRLNLDRLAGEAMLYPEAARALKELDNV